MEEFNPHDDRLISIELSNGQICYGHQYNYRPDSQSIGIFVHGFRSSSKGTKASYFRQQAQIASQHWIDFDLPCHGRSDGVFRSFRISYCLEALVKVIDSVGNTPIVLVGSSMGGWLSILAAIRLLSQRNQTHIEHEKSQIKGVVLIAPAFDFVEHYFREKMNVDKHCWESVGVMGFDDAYDNERFFLDFGVLKDASKHSVLKNVWEFNFPTLIFHGEKDDVVPISISQRFVGIVQGETPVNLEIIQKGDHSLNDHLAHFWAGIDGCFRRS
ncbi:MAG: alpha/beta fold hydrolase [Gammaproteobacteria bacterium]|nr:alpha/beta fold hydrolase [Gammaproteobacteria bacterium]